MTWAQTTFAYCFLVLVPLVGILFARRWKHSGKPGWKGFLVGSALMFAAMICCCVLAITVYPRYPAIPVPELLANAFTLPAIVIVLAAFWIPRPSIERRKFAVRCSMILLVFYFMGIGFTRWATMWSYRRALPWSATDIREYAWTDGFLPDFTYHMRAKISEEEFRRYIERYGLKEGLRERGGYLSPREKSHWWNPPETATNYSRESGDWYMRAIYSNGYIYVEAGEF